MIFNLTDLSFSYYIKKILKVELGAVAAYYAVVELHAVLFFQFIYKRLIAVHISS